MVFLIQNQKKAFLKWCKYGIFAYAIINLHRYIYHTIFKPTARTYFIHPTRIWVSFKYTHSTKFQSPHKTWISIRCPEISKILIIPNGGLIVIYSTMVESVKKNLKTNPRKQVTEEQHCKFAGKFYV